LKLGSKLGHAPSKGKAMADTKSEQRKGSAVATSRKRERKDNRPQEIVAAAFEEFAAKGYAATKVEDVAARARVSKGLPYLYFKTKEELFKAVVRSVITSHFDVIREQMEQTDLPVEAFLKGPFLAFVQELVSSKRAFIARLLIAEGHKHPELTAFYYEQVVSRGIATMTRLIERGIERGEFKPTPLRDYPQLLFAPVLTAIIWRGLFERYRHLDTDGLLRTNIELLTDAIRAPGVTPQSGMGVA
jgi:AcrR family transcriptional regulator